MRLKNIPEKLAVLIAAVCFLYTARADDTPEWLMTAAAQDVSKVDSKAPAVVLINEKILSVNPQGVKTITSRSAIRVLKREGYVWCTAQQFYNTDTVKVTDFRAWLIQPDSKVKKYEKGETADLSLVSDEVYNEARVKTILAQNDAEQNAVFGYEAVVEDRSIFALDEWSFQNQLPVLISRFTVQTPPKWSVTGLIFNHPAITPISSGDTTSWEMRNLPYVELQPMMPSLTSFFPRIAITVAPASKALTTFPLRSFASWNDVAGWFYELMEEPSRANAPISTKAAELTATAVDELDKILRIGRYVQDIKYAAISLGVGRGGGYRPKPAAEVFARSYGDCKDKVNLMRSFLRTLKIDSFGASAYLGDRHYIRAEWPSPHQFNHEIIAIRVSDAVSAPSVISHPQLGRLLIFDPTDAYTPVGDIPIELQGSLILVSGMQTQSLVQLPVIAAEHNRLDRTVEATLSADARLNARITERMYGQTATQERASFSSRQKGEYQKQIESWVASAVGGAQVSNIECVDDFSANRFDLKFEFSTEGFAQLMQGRLLIFRPALLTRRKAAAVTEGQRTNPIEIQHTSFVETALITLPQGFDIDELPESLAVETEFGSYEGRFQTEGQVIKYQRRLVLKPMILPAEKYREVKAFFDRISAVEQAPAVLIKK